MIYSSQKFKTISNIYVWTYLYIYINHIGSMYIAIPIKPIHPLLVFFYYFGHFFLLWPLRWGILNFKCKTIASAVVITILNFLNGFLNKWQ